MRRTEMTGMRVGRLTVGCLGIGSVKAKVYWDCLCDCGKSTTVDSGALQRGTTKSCGCLKIDNLRSAFRPLKYASLDVNTLRPTPEYRAWSAMKQRCRNPKATGYVYYGARGITVCERWDLFENFLADMGPRPENPEGWGSRVPCYSLDRIDVNGNYEPGNCRWATTVEQANNKRG